MTRVIPSGRVIPSERSESRDLHLRSAEPAAVHVSPAASGKRSAKAVSGDMEVIA